jgi:hypothetical protein
MMQYNNTGGNMKDKILALQKHLQSVKNSSANPSKKYAGDKLSAYKQWVALEIKRTEAKIEKLK